MSTVTEMQDKVLGAKFLERRGNARLLLSLPMEIQQVNEHGEKVSQECESIDISREDVCFRGAQKLSPGADITVTFYLPFDNGGHFRILKTRGRVVRVRENSGEEKETALKFVEELKFFSP